MSLPCCLLVVASLSGHTTVITSATAIPVDTSANLGTYLGTITGPSGLASQNSFRLDSWWLEKRVLGERLIVRAGQFAAQDFYGAQLFGPSSFSNHFSTASEIYSRPMRALILHRPLRLKCV